MNRGKEFEKIVKRDFENLNGSTIDRLRDPTFYNKGIKNICDFIAYKYPSIYYIECKATKGNTLYLPRITQYEDLKSKQGIKGVVSGVLIWYIEHQKVVWVDVKGIEERIDKNVKSVNIKELGTMHTYELSSETPRVYPKIDFNSLVEIYKGE